MSLADQTTNRLLIFLPGVLLAAALSLPANADTAWPEEEAGAAGTPCFKAAGLPPRPVRHNPAGRRGGRRCAGTSPAAGETR